MPDRPRSPSKPTIFYNDNDRFAAAWLRELIKDGLLPEGEVNETSITELKPGNITTTQAHFFAGIGGWPYALQLAGWPTSAPVWTGSCPCQPFSIAGKRRGNQDERHLWPEWFRLIRECRPPVVFGEQVSGKAGLNWLDEVFADLEACGYAVGAADLPAAGVGIDQKRQRLYWVGSDSNPKCCGRERFKPAKKTVGWSRQEFERLVQEAIRLSVSAGNFGALSDGLPNRVGLLRGAGNAIVPQVAAQFIKAFLAGWEMD